MTSLVESMIESVQSEQIKEAFEESSKRHEKFKKGLNR